MAEQELTGVAISALGNKIYREKIRPLMTKADIGKYVIVDVYSGEYEIDENCADADLRLEQRAPDACGFILRVGYSAAFFFGWHEEPEL